MELRYTERARSDLLDIYAVIAERNQALAEACTRRIAARCLQLVRFPHSAPIRPDISPDARALVVERWLAVYRITQIGVQIVRIVDGARDLSNLELPSE